MPQAVPQELPPFLRAWRAGPWASAGPSWLRDLRKSAMDHFSRTGLPVKAEAWRHTPLEALAGAAWAPAPAGSTVKASALDAHHFASEGPRAVFVDGRFDAALSQLGGLPAGLHVQSLADALRRDDPVVADQLGRSADPDQAFAALNLAFFEDGALVRVDAGAQVRDPLHLVFLHSGGHGGPTMVHPRLLLVAGPRSDSSFVETHATLGTGATLTNAVVEVLAGQDASVRRVKVQREGLKASHVAQTHARLGRNAHFDTFLLSLGGGTVRDEVHVKLEAEGAECSVDGLFLGTGRQSVDCVTQVDHTAPHATSRQLYKGILDGAARGAFTGKVVVHADAQKTNAEQTNRNLLLSDRALVDSVPALEIHADDVKCSHGSTIGRLGDEALFFLRSRGIGTEQARLMLTQAFAREALERIAHDGVRAHVDGLLRSWFAGRKDVEVDS